MEEEQGGPGPPPDRLPTPTWKPQANVMSRVTSSMPPPPVLPQRRPPAPQQLPNVPREDLTPFGTETPAEGPAPVTPHAGASNVVALLSQWADDHLHLIRNISTGMAVAGVILFARSIKLTSKFLKPSDIPIEFIKNHVKLRGRLHQITEKGLELEHIPISIPLISSWRRQPSGFLLIKLAGVELTEAGQLWLRKELRPFQVLWFQLLARDNSSLLCYVLMNRGIYFTVSLNEEILRRGLGKTVLIKELDQTSKMYWAVHKKLLKAELRAIKRGEGIWKEDTEKSSYVEKFKDSWREIWREDNPFKKMSLWELDLKRKSCCEVLKSQCKKCTDKLSNCSFALKVREFLRYMKLGKR